VNNSILTKMSDRTLQFQGDKIVICLNPVNPSHSHTRYNPWILFSRL